MLESANRMDAYNFFVDDQGHLRSGWRLAIFAVAFIISVQLSHALFIRTLALVLHRSNLAVGNSNWGVLACHGSILFSALIVGWACGALLEELPIGSLGITPHQGWLKNLLIGSLLGGASLLLAAGLTAATRGGSFCFGGGGAGSSRPTARAALTVL